MTPFPHQIATRAVGGKVYVSSLRDPCDGSTSYVIAYSFGHHAGPKWLSSHRFQSVDQAEAGALILADFLGAEYRG